MTRAYKEESWQGSGRSECRPSLHNTRQAGSGQWEVVRLRSRLLNWGGKALPQI